MNRGLFLLLCGLWPAALPGPVVCEELPLGHADFYPSPTRPVGFRGDRTDCYPGATPPTRWSVASNVVWKTEVGAGESNPIIVGKRLYVLTDGIFLRCLNAEDGKVLWERRRHAMTNDVRGQLACETEQFVSLHFEIAAAQAEHNRLRQKLDAMRKEATNAGTVLDTEAETEIARQIANCAEKADAMRARQKGLGQFDRLGIRADGVTYAIATPCSDGKFLYAFLPTGETVCYDLDGRRKWFRMLGKLRIGGGWEGGQVGPSPLLLEGKLIVHYRDAYCLDAQTGAVLWKCPIEGLAVASPVPVRKSGEWFVGLGSGQILSLAGGDFVFGGENGNGAAVGSPVGFGDRICWGQTTVQITDNPTERARVIWRTKADGGWHGYASPLHWNGKVYYLTEGAEFLAWDAETGRQIAATKVACGGGVYPSLTMAGGHFYLSSEGGNTLVLKPVSDTEYQTVTENRLERLGGNRLVFHGDRMYVHSGVSVYCIRDAGTNAPPATTR